MALIFDHILPAPLADNAPEDSFWRSRRELVPGNRYAIIASSGRGKSTLVNIAYGIRHDYSGTYLIEGRPASELTQEDWSKLRQETFSCVFQDLKLFPQLSTRENILLKCTLTDPAMLSRAEAMAERLGMAAFLDKPCGQLSMGQQQRIAVIRALCQPFQYLFLDEPTSHLDRENTEKVLTLVMEVAQAQHAAVIITGLDREYRLPEQFQYLNI
jgi:ABC-type lipoprotein export system ATPase subunit